MNVLPVAKGEVLLSPSGARYQLINSDDKPLFVLFDNVDDLAKKGFEIGNIPRSISFAKCNWISLEVKNKTLESWNK